MDKMFFSFISLIGGLAFFLYGMKVMSQNLEKMAGGKLEYLLKKMTANPVVSLFLGAIITIAVQSSSATTVMLVGLVNSGIMKFSQTASVIFGANVGTTLTAWILSLSSISSDNIFLQMLKPINFSPVFAFIGVLVIMISKSEKKIDVGYIFIGFAILMYGMTIMSSSVAPLTTTQEFNEVLTKFNNPIFALVAGVVFTAIIQSSAASIGVLQAISMASGITYFVAIPLIIGQNIGTCITSILSCIGTNSNAKRVATLHVMIKVIGMLICLPLYCLLESIFHFSFSFINVTPFSIALIHTVYNIIITILLMPFTKFLLKLTSKIIKSDDDNGGLDFVKDELDKLYQKIPMIDDRLFRQPTFVINECESACKDMAGIVHDTLLITINNFDNYSKDNDQVVLTNENIVDEYEDRLGIYLVKLASKEISNAASCKISKMLHVIGDFERLTDYAVDILYISKELKEKNVKFSEEAKHELEVLADAVTSVIDLAVEAYLEDDLVLSYKVESLKHVIDDLTVKIKSNHVDRLKRGACTIEQGIALTDYLTVCKHVAEHCANVALAVIELSIELEHFDSHKNLSNFKISNDKFQEEYDEYMIKYQV